MGELDIKDRISTIMRLEQMNASQFADAVNVQKSSISHVLGGRNNPSLDVVLKIINRFPHYNADWLLRGVGERSKQETTGSLFDEEDNKKSKNTGKGTDVKQVTPPVTNVHEEPTQRTDPQADDNTQKGTQAENFNQGTQYNTNPTGNTLNPNTGFNAAQNQFVNNNQPPYQNLGNGPVNAPMNQIFNSFFGDKQVVNVVIFYADRTFREFRPSQD